MTSNRPSVENLLFECPICIEEVPINEIEAFVLCEHICCFECMKEFYRRAIHDVQDTNSIGVLTCYVERHPISKEAQSFFYIWLQSKIEQLFPDDEQLKSRYKDIITVMTSGKQLKKCGNSKCVKIFGIESHYVPTCVRCPDCDFAQCVQCSRKWNDAHTKLSCDQYSQWLYDNDSDTDHVDALRLVAKNEAICPKCKTLYVHQPGRPEHLICTRCSTEFCPKCSALFYFGHKEPRCTIAACLLKNTFHAHCLWNCFREIRDADYPEFYQVLKKNGINTFRELREEFPDTGNKCLTNKCTMNTIPESENRLCKYCYQTFLWAFIWYRQIEPWELYQDNQLEQILRKTSIKIPQNSNRQTLIQLCQKNLNKTLGKPQVTKGQRKN